MSTVLLVVHLLVAIFLVALILLQRSGGVEIVPAAIVHGFLLSLLVPILIAFFTA